jgi:hypothetical protein
MYRRNEVSLVIAPANPLANLEILVLESVNQFVTQGRFDGPFVWLRRDKNATLGGAIQSQQVAAKMFRYTTFKIKLSGDPTESNQEVRLSSLHTWRSLQLLVGTYGCEHAINVGQLQGNVELRIPASKFGDFTSNLPCSLGKFVKFCRIPRDSSLGLGALVKRDCPRSSAATTNKCKNDAPIVRRRHCPLTT